jgi:hypothetical protein
MTAVSKTYTFVPGDAIESDEVNQNFDDLVNYTNNEVVVRDASKAFTAIPSGPGTNPTSPNQFARKQYVDDREAVVTAVNTAQATTLATHTTDLTKRPTINNNATNVRMISESVVVTTDANGDAQINFPAGHLTTCANVVAVNGAMNAGPIAISTISIIDLTNTHFTFRAYRVTSVAPFGTYILEGHASALVRVNYIATGT